MITAQHFLVINDQDWLKSQIKRINWEKSKEELEIKKRRKVIEKDLTQDKRQKANW